MRRKTGLLDDAGKMIYEGDTIMLPNGDVCEVKYIIDQSLGFSGFQAIPRKSIHKIREYTFFSGIVIAKGVSKYVIG